MAILAIPAIPALAAWFGSAFIALATFLGGFLTKRIALAVAGIAALGLAFTTFYAAITALLVGVAIPFPAVDPLYNCFLPTNIKACLSIILSARVLRWVYDWSNTVIQLKLGI
jgi:hypothetical protein